MLVVQLNSQNKILEFHKLTDLLEKQEENIKLQNPFYKLKFQHEINDYFYQKDNILEHIFYKNFLIIQTTDNLQIYRESRRKILKKIFALPVEFLNLKKSQFRLMFDNELLNEKSAENAKGVFFYLEEHSINIFFIRHLFEKKQTLLDEHYCVELLNFDHDQLLSIIPSSHKFMKLVTYTENFIFLKYKFFQSKNKIHASPDCFNLINNQIDADKFIYNHKSIHIFGTLQEERKIFTELKNFYEKQFYFKLISLQNNLKESYWTLIGSDVFVSLNLKTRELEFYQSLQSNQVLTLKNKFHLDILKDVLIIKIKFIPLSEEYFLIGIESNTFISIFKVNMQNKDFSSIEQIFMLEKEQLSKFKIEYYQIFQKESKSNIYKICFFNTNQEVTSLELIDKNLTKCLKKTIQFKEQVLEIIINHHFPYNYIVLTSSNKLYFYTNSLQFQCDFDLSFMKLQLNNNPNNFNLKYIYDQYYVLYAYDQIYFGQLDFNINKNMYEFNIIDFQNYYLLPLNYQINTGSQIRDKIVYYNHKNVCIRNNNRLVYGNLNLQPLSLEGLNAKEFPYNVHKYIVLKYYKNTFFNNEFVDFCLKQGYEYFLYFLIFQGIEEKKKIKYEFDPQLILENYNMTQKQFFEKTQINSEFEIFQKLQNLQQSEEFEKLKPHKKQLLQQSIDKILQTKQNSQSLDALSRIFFVEFSSKGKEKFQMTSELVFLAICSDQQDFIFSSLFGDQTSLNPPTLADLKKYCIFYWHENVQQLKQIIDKAIMSQYKKEKKIFDIILWFVILGKTKLLSPLFKLEAGQQKFVAFFASNFNDDEVIEKTLNNAYVLKSQKKLDICIAFFILAKQYQEAISISLVDNKDPQLAVLIYRIFEQEIGQNEQQLIGIKNLFQEYFFDQSVVVNDYFLQAITHFILNQHVEMLKSLISMITIQQNFFINEEKKKLTLDYGFTFVNYSPQLSELFNHFEISGSHKRFWVEAKQDIAENLNFQILKKNFNFFNQKQALYMSLFTLIQIKQMYPDNFKDFVDEYRQMISQILVEIYLKKLSVLINHNQYWRLKDKQQKIQDFCQFFGVDFQFLQKSYKRRIELIDDFELNLFIHLNNKEYSEANDYFQKLLERLIKLNKKLLIQDMFEYYSSHKWISKIKFVEKFLEMLNNLFIPSDEFYLELHRKYKNDFCDTILFWLFLLTIHTNCWEEAIFIIDNYQTLDVLSKDFSLLLNKIKQKISEKYLFYSHHPIKNTEKLKYNFSNINLVVFLFMKILYLNSYIKLKISDQNQFSMSNFLKLKLNVEMDYFQNGLKSKFQKQLLLFTFEEKKQIKNELITLFTLEYSLIKRTNFFILNPNEALNLEQNNKINSEHLDVKSLFEMLEDFHTLYILQDDYKNLSPEKFKERKEFFKNGIEIFKSKPEQTTFNSTNSIQKILISKSEIFPEIYIQINKYIRKVYLFDSLFRKMRKESGYQMKSYDDLNSVSVVSETPSVLSENFLTHQPLILRILFNFLFKGKNTPKNRHQNYIIEKIIDGKVQKYEKLTEVNCLENHPDLPVMFLGEQNRLLIISRKTLGTLVSYQDQALSKIKHIYLDPSGYKILVIDSQKNAFVLKYDISFNAIEEIYKIENKNIYSGAWFEHGTKIIFTTKNNTILILDFIEQAVEERKCEFESALNCVIIGEKQNLMINKKTAALTLFDLQTLNMKEQDVQRSQSQISCFIYQNEKNILILGFKNGDLNIYDMSNLNLLDSQNFEDKEKKKLTITSINFLGDFILAAFSNGLMSIVGKI